MWSNALVGRPWGQVGSFPNDKACRALSDHELPSFLFATPTDIQLNTASDYALDVADLERFARPTGTQPRGADLHRQLLPEALCADLLAGLAVPDSEAFEAWVLDKQEYYHRLALEILDDQNAAFEAAGNYEKAVAAARLQLKMEPWLEEAHRRCMRDLALAGESGVVFVSGDAGNGKTVLLEGFAASAMAEHPDLLVAGARCNPGGSLDAFAPLRRLGEILFGDLASAAAWRLHGHDQADRLQEATDSILTALAEHGPGPIDTLVPAGSVARRAGLSPCSEEQSSTNERIARSPGRDCPQAAPACAV